MKLGRINLNENLSTLLSGSILSQVIPVLTAPILTRLYLPENYGLLGILISLTTLLGVIGTLQYSTAIILPKEDEDAVQLLMASVFILAAISIVLFLIFFFSNYIIADQLQISEFKKIVLIVPFGVLIMGINSIFTAYANRKKKYKILSFNRVLTAITSAFLSIILGLIFKQNNYGLIVGYYSGLILGTCYLIYSISRASKNLYRFDKFRAFNLLKQYKNFPKFTLGTEVINSLIFQLPVFLLGKFLGTSAVGYYNMSNRILGLPIVTISSSIGEIFRQKSAEEFHKHGNCASVFVKTSKNLFLLSILPFTVLIVFGGDLFAFVFGENWRIAGIYSQYMGILFFFKFNVGPLTFVYYLVKKHQEDLFLHLLLLVIGVMSFYFGFLWLGPDKKILLIYALGYCFIYSIYYLRSFKFSTQKLKVI